MRTFYFQSNKIPKKASVRYSLLTRKAFTGFYIVALMICCSSCNPYLRNERVPHARIEQLPDATTRARSTAYRESISKGISDTSLMPFYPFISINLRDNFLPPPPFRLYLGKRTTAAINDYVLIAVACRRAGAIYSDIREGGSTSRSRNIPAGNKWYLIRTQTLNATEDNVIYKGLGRSKAKRYVRRFDRFTKARKLSRAFPLCFVVDNTTEKFAESKDGLIKLQPVPNPQSRNVNPSGNNGGKRSVFSFKKLFASYDGDYTLQDPNNYTKFCCESPPETGHLIDY